MAEASESGSQASGLEEITERELMDLVILNWLIDLHTVLPVRVESYDVNAQTVDVTVMINRLLPDGDGGWVSEEFPQIPDVPVGHYAGGGMIIALPIKKGDTGEVHFHERNPGAWRQTGNQVDPGDVRLHGLDGGTFYPTLRPIAKKFANADANNLVIGSDSNANARIVIKPSGEIDLGDGANDQVARFNEVKAHLDMLLQAIAGTNPTLVGLGLLVTAVKAMCGPPNGTGSPTILDDMGCPSVKVPS